MGRRKGRYEGYDFEEAFQRQTDTLEEWEWERLLKEKKINSAYRTKTTKAGSQIEVDIYPAFAKKEQVPRTKKRNASRQAQKNLNEKRARRYLTNLAHANFGEGDLWGTFGYDEDHLPADLEAAQKYFSNFLRRVNRKRKKQGKENLKYIYVTEYSDDPNRKIRCHHHIIFSGDQDRDEIEKMWQGGSRPQTRRIIPDDKTGITGLMEYVCKDPKGKKRWNASRNLKKPEITKSFSKFGKNTVYQMATDHEKLKEQLLKKYPGYKFIDAQVQINNFNEGFYIYARMVRD